MSLAGGDLTTLARLETWLEGWSNASTPVLQQLITACSNGIRAKLNRGNLQSKSVIQTFDGTGNPQLILHSYPVTAITNVQMGGAIIGPSPLPNLSGNAIPASTFGYGYRFIPWNGSLPGEPSALEFVNGIWFFGRQNIQITYNAGYLVASEPASVPSPAGPYVITTQQLFGLQCKDNGVVYAATGATLQSVADSGLLGPGKYVPPSDSSPGVYTFSSSDADAAVLISYSFVPSDLEEACIQYVAERWSYRGRVGQESKSLGGQETVRFMRGGMRGQMFPDLPPEVEGLIWPYVNVIPPSIGAPV